MIAPRRECGDCGKCCEGWLHCSVLGHAVHREKPCFFLHKTCTIYENRPDEPCKSYECSWLSEDVFPMWMKPNLANIIITKRSFMNKQTNQLEEYHEILEAGSIIDSRTLNWLVLWAIRNNRNIYYQVNDVFHKIGSREFLMATL